MKPLFSFLLLICLASCNGDKSTDANGFNETLIQSLYNQLDSNFEIDFAQNHLENLLRDISITELKEGAEIEKEMLFEDFECECYDKLKISYSKTDDRYILWVYEEFYEEDLDWCPESSYSYSFTVKDNKVENLKLDFMAG